MVYIFIYNKCLPLWPNHRLNEILFNSIKFQFHLICDQKTYLLFGYLAMMFAIKHVYHRELNRKKIRIFILV